MHLNVATAKFEENAAKRGGEVRIFQTFLHNVGNDIIENGDNFDTYP